MDFTGRVALITGAAGGIGGAAAERFAALGADVHLVDVDEDGLARRAESVAATGRRATTSTADVTKSADVRGYVDAALREHGRIDAFFNNAGIEGPVATLAEYPEEEFERVVGVNLFGVFLGLRHVLPVMLEQGSGAIVNTGSLASERGLPSSGAYIATKHAVLGLTRTAASEVAGRGVRVNAVLPGMIDTRMLRDLGAAAGRRRGGRHGVPGHGRPPPGAPVSPRRSPPSWRSSARTTRASCTAWAGPWTAGRWRRWATRRRRSRPSQPTAGRLMAPRGCSFERRARAT